MPVPLQIVKMLLIVCRPIIIMLACCMDGNSAAGGPERQAKSQGTRLVAGRVGLRIRVPPNLYQWHRARRTEPNDPHSGPASQDPARCGRRSRQRSEVESKGESTESRRARRQASETRVSRSSGPSATRRWEGRVDKFEAAELLPEVFLDPTLDHRFTGMVAKVFEIVQLDHQACRLGRPATTYDISRKNVGAIVPIARKSGL